MNTNYYLHLLCSPGACTGRLAAQLQLTATTPLAASAHSRPLSSRSPANTAARTLARMRAPHPRIRRNRIARELGQSRWINAQCALLAAPL